ncbi:glycosyltransferase family 1 protein [Variovorax sp. J22R115]|uniref:glycosyltransferase family 4 protein n=1 Tax=Variovorax sp. J22R115 TaxID=3053509 RepID=UPI0025762DC7|nr:glycosyltransferase family 1 protein [Variovorax sp. J22R115]MDM0049022.1 glycosyltransferase family 1 protein [Variovorax sp. J22R115]
MRLVIDIQGVQSPGSRTRGIGRYSLALARTMVARSQHHEVILALNGRFPDAVEEMKLAFDGLVERSNFRIWHPPPYSDRSSAGSGRARERLYEAFLASLRPDVVHVSSLFEGNNNAAVTSVGTFVEQPTAVTLYDLIPLIHKRPYLEDPVFRSWYMRKIDSLRRADMWLAISESSRREGILHLGLDRNRCINISSAASEHFRPCRLSAEHESALRGRHSLDKPFVMYTGGMDHRKNLDGLIRAFALLPPDVRSQHQLAIVCLLGPDHREALLELAKREGLQDGTLVITGYVPDEDLVDLYNTCTLFVFPSRHEGFGLPALEAMHCGAAVVAANTSSLPELIGREDALFDPRDDQSIADKIFQGLTDSAFRTTLSEHGLRQAGRFSWDESARLAIEGLEALHKDAVGRRPYRTAQRADRPRLAYLSPFSPEPGPVADYAVKLIPELARHYDIDLVSDLSAVSDPGLAISFPLRSIEWFKKHADLFDRVIYHFANTSRCRHMLSLLSEIPGVVVLHDFHLSELYAPNDPATPTSYVWMRALYESHGYQAIAHPSITEDAIDTVRKFPCNLSVIRHAQGVIVNSPHFLELARDWYGPAIADEWATISPPSTPSFTECAQRYSAAIEHFFEDTSSGRSRLVRIIGASDPLTESPDQGSEVAEISSAIAESLPLKMPHRQMLIDVSELTNGSVRTDAQQLIEPLVLELLNAGLPNFRVEPVYASDGIGWRYARRYALGLLNCPTDVLPDEPVDLRRGDVFIDLDARPPEVIEKRDVFRKLRHAGVHVTFVVGDMLPSQWDRRYPQESNELHETWLHVLAENDGALCFSQSVESQLTSWLTAHCPARSDPGSRIKVLHPSSDSANGNGALLQDFIEAVLDVYSPASEIDTARRQKGATVASSPSTTSDGNDGIL